MSFSRVMAFSVLSMSLAYAAPGFKQQVPFPTFESWIKQATVPGFTFKEAKDEPEAFLATLKGQEILNVKIEGAGKFEGLAGTAKPAKSTWNGHEAIYFTSTPGTTFAVRFADSKATLSITVSGSPKPRSAPEMEKLLGVLNPGKILK